jgi:hypothetical protein
MIYSKIPLALTLVLIMAGCNPTPAPTPTPPTPIPTPTPEPTPVPPNTIIIEGPTNVGVNQTATLNIKGASPSQLASGKVVWWPRDDIEVLPVQTWGGEPLLMVRSNIASNHIIQVMTAQNNDLLYAEHVIQIGQTPDPVPPGPVPPGPIPPGPIPPGPVPPNPVPPTPDPIVPPVPVYKEPLSLLLIEESADRDNVEEATAVLSEKVIQLIAKKNWYRHLLDKDVVDKDGKTPAVVKPYIERAVGKGLPWYIVVDTDGRIIVEGKIETEDGLLEVLGKL